jgi:hypothetical protein
MDLGFLLSLIAFLGGIWIYMLGHILDLTLRAPADSNLLFFGFVHFIIFLYLVTALLVFYKKSLNSVRSTRSRADDSGSIETLLFKTWPAILLILLIAFFSTNLDFPEAFQFFFVIIYLLVAAYGLWLYISTVSLAKGSDRPIYRNVIFRYFMTVVISAPLSIAFLILMSTLFADVQIKTDKEFYRIDDPILVSVRSGGYVLRPFITKVSCGTLEFNTPGLGDSVVHIGPNRRCQLRVEYEPQVIPLKLIKTHDLIIAPTEEGHLP